MAQGGASPWLRALTATINSGTWMTLRGDDQVVRTRRGTRPGSSWADLTFGVLIRRILQLRDASRQHVNCPCVPVSIPWDGLRDWRPAEQPVGAESLADIVWADDVASCYELEQATAAKKGAGLEASFLVDLLRLSCPRALLWSAENSRPDKSARARFADCSARSLWGQARNCYHARRCWCCEASGC